MSLFLLTTRALGGASASSLGLAPLLPLPDWAAFCALAGASVLILGFALLLPGLPWVARHTDFVAMTRRHLRRYAPLYFVAGPPAVVYFAMVGGLSIMAVYGFNAIHVHVMQHHLDTLQQWEQHGLITVLKGTEYVCSFIGALGFAWIIRWAGLPRFWFVILAVSLCMSAAYRTARHEQGRGRGVISGPAILMSPEWVDALPVLLGMGTLAFSRRSPSSSSTANERETA